MILIIAAWVLHKHHQPSKHKSFVFVQRRPNVFAFGPALYKCYTNVIQTPSRTKFLGDFFQVVIQFNSIQRYLLSLEMQYEQNNSIQIK